MKNVTTETSFTVWTWPVQDIRDEKSYSSNFPYCLHVACPTYIHDEKGFTRDFTYCLQMACPAIISDENSCSRNISYCLQMVCPAYIRDEKFAPETSPSVSTWLLHPIYVRK
jgi:predicted DNA-binding ribbon-helix-helix protein